MPQRDQHNAIPSVSQAPIQAEQCWEELVHSRLPAELDEQAQQLGAWRRKRHVGSASQLLRALLCYVLCLTSLKQLSGWSRLSGISTTVLSAQAWQKRLHRSAPWLLWLFTRLLQVRLQSRFHSTQQRILLVDATHLAQLGPKGAVWNLHSAYELETSQLAWVQVTDHHLGESLARLPIQAGDILVGDGAYSRVPQLFAVEEAHACSLTRFSPWHLPVYARSALAQTPEFRVDVVGWLQGLRPGTYQRHAVVFSQGKRLPVRLIAVVLPDEKAEALRQLKRRQARDKGRTLSEQTVFLAGFHLLVTTLPEKQWPVSLVLELYAARWQIEILFKRIKQVLDTHRLPCRCPQMALAMIAALLVAWLLIEDEASELRRQITDGEPLSLPVSSWQLNQWTKASLQHVVRGWWSPAQLRAVAPELRRLFHQKRQRPLREHQRQVRFHVLLAEEI
jgi:DDE family transposase